MRILKHPRTKWFLLGMVVGVAALWAGQPVWSYMPWRCLDSGKVTGIIYSSSAFDVSDDRRLVGWADSVFFGQVLQRLGHTEEPGPQTQFSVKVLEVLKGSMGEVVTVSQHGGCGGRWWNTGRVLMADSLGPLEPGTSYLFLARTNPQTGWHTLVTGYGEIVLFVPKHACDECVLDRGHTNKLRQQYTAAVEHQIPYVPGIP